MEFARDSAPMLSTKLEMAESREPCDEASTATSREATGLISRMRERHTAEYPDPMRMSKSCEAAQPPKAMCERTIDTPRRVALARMVAATTTSI